MLYRTILYHTVPYRTVRQTGQPADTSGSNTSPSVFPPSSLSLSLVKTSSLSFSLLSLPATLSSLSLVLSSFKKIEYIPPLILFFPIFFISFAFPFSFLFFSFLCLSAISVVPFFFPPHYRFRSFLSILPPPILSLLLILVFGPFFFTPGSGPWLLFAKLTGTAGVWLPRPCHVHRLRLGRVKAIGKRMVSLVPGRK